MIDRLSGRIALLVVVVASLLIVLLGWFVLLSPERAKANKLDSQIGDTNTQLAAVTSLLDGPAGRQALVSLRVFQKAIPDDAKMSQIMRQLSAAAAASGVELDSIGPSALVPGNSSETLPISLAVTGHYFGLQKFLHLLRGSADLSGDQVKATGRLFTVDNIQFSGGGQLQSASSSTQTSSSSVISATLALNAFVYDAAAVAVTPAPPTATTSSATTTP